MAQHSIQHLVTEELTAEDIHKALPDETHIEHPDDGGRLVAMSRRAEDKVTRWVRQQQVKKQAPAQPAEKADTAEPKATDKQVAFIMKLIGQGKHEEGCWFDGPTTREGAAKMTKSSASTYITALLDT